MKTQTTAALFLATFIAAPAFADADIPYPDEPAAVAAQPSGLTRAQVRAELVQLEKAGYDPTSDQTEYPKNIQAAEARVAAQDEVAKASMSHGKIRKIDTAAGELTIKAGPVENLGMDAMTMAYKVQDPAMLSQVKVGDKIDFIAEEANEVAKVTKLQKQ